MEQQLAESQWSNPLDSVVTVVKEREVIHRLEGQVDEQRKMRLNDAKQVEAKAAKIKEWVTNKLREVRLPIARSKLRNLLSAPSRAVFSLVARPFLLDISFGLVWLSCTTTRANRLGRATILPRSFAIMATLRH